MTEKHAERRPGWWASRIEVGPALFFFATLNWVLDIAVPHAGDAIREQRLVPGFLWFAGGLALLLWSGITALNSYTRATRDRHTSA